VSLENKGRIHLSNQVVMRVALSRLQDQRPVELYGEPYFQGAVFIDYVPEERGGRWVSWRPNFSPPGETRGLRLQTTSTLVRQDIALEASTSRRRFAIMPVQPASEMAVVAYGPPTRSDADNLAIPRQQRYSLATPAILSGRQLHAIPIRPPSVDGPAAVDAELARAAEFDDSRFPRLAEMASQVLAEHELFSGSSLDKALALERHFLSQNAYNYSLNLNVDRDFEIDPIEDFVASHRTGHCEYFASALVMMLRSQGIPARMINGYRGGSFNSVGRYFVVQQQHAHSWVEAWVPTEEVPASEFAGMAGEWGAWYRLDPTPRSEALLLAEQTRLGQRLVQAFDYVELLWRDYVLSLNKNRQEDIFYDPLQARTSMLPSWVESRSVQRWLRRMSSLWGLEFAGGRDRGGARAIEGSLAVLVIGGLVLTLVVVQGARIVSRMLWRWRTRGEGAARGARRAPEFYRRMERVLARLPLVRRQGQTAAELATAAQARLLAVEGAALTAHVPGEVVEAYYRIRFGDGRLDRKETEAIEQAVDALSPAVRQVRQR
jgi:transglutaminase-like putative cysteine protease